MLLSTDAVPGVLKPCLVFPTWLICSPPSLGFASNSVATHCSIGILTLQTLHAISHLLFIT